MAQEVTSRGGSPRSAPFNTGDAVISETRSFGWRFAGGALMGMVVAQLLSLLFFGHDIPPFAAPPRLQSTLAFLEAVPVILGGTVVAWRLRTRPAPEVRRKWTIPVLAGVSAMVTSVALLAVVGVIIKAGSMHPAYLAVPFLVNGTVGFCFAAAALSWVRRSN